MQTLNTQHITSNEFKDAYLASAPGDSWVYATGDLAHTRHEAQSKAGNRGIELDGVAELAMRMSVEKKVCLTQRRLKPYVFEYLATKRTVNAGDRQQLAMAV